MRDAEWHMWPNLPAQERCRVLRQLRTWYDVHRFRSSPQNQELGEAAVAEGGVRFIAARLQAVPAADEGLSIAVTWKRLGAELPQTQSFDAVINCTGLDALVALSANPFLLSAKQRGWLRRDACSMGFEVDDQCCAVGADGTAQPAVRVVGPPTVGTFGDPIGAMYIGAQIHRMLDDALLSHLPCTASPTRTA